MGISSYLRFLLLSTTILDALSTKMLSSIIIAVIVSIATADAITIAVISSTFWWYSVVSSRAVRLLATKWSITPFCPSKSVSNNWAVSWDILCTNIEICSISSFKL